MPPTIGTRIGNCRIVAPLGAGGMGEWGRNAGFPLAQAPTLRGEIDAALERLDRAYETRDVEVGLAKTSRHLNGLHGDPRWAASLRRIGPEP